MSNRVLIAGAGIGGLACAIILGRAGHEVVVLERAEQPAALGAGLSVFPNALAVLNELGVGEHVLNHARVASRAVRMTPEGHVLSVEEVQRITVHRGELYELLLDQLHDAVIRPGRSVAGFRETAGAVTVTTTAGETISGDVLVGADGLNSRVRAQLWGDRPPRPAGVVSWRGIAPMGGLEDAQQYVGRGIRLGMAPVDDSRTYWYATRRAKPGSRSGSEGARAELLEMFSRWHPSVGEVIAATPEEQIVVTDIRDRPPIREWGRGRVTLLGDAAHPMTPDLGQGAAQAMEDASALGKHLGNSPDVAAGLRAYEDERIPLTTAMVLAARKHGRLLQLKNPVATAIRNAAMRRRHARASAT